MNNVEAVDMAEAFQDLAEQAPDLSCFLRQVPRNQVA